FLYNDLWKYAREWIKIKDKMEALREIISRFIVFLCFLLFIGSSCPSSAQQIHLSGLSHSIPNPFLLSDGTLVSSGQQWYKQRRPELLELFAKQMYGQSPESPQKLEFKTFDIDSLALNGLATRKQIALFVGEGQNRVRIDLLLYLPNYIKKPAPVFLGLNFEGNQTVIEDTAIRITTSWEYSGYEGVFTHRATEKSGGVESDRWPVKMILKRGYGIATMYAGDIAPDRKEGYKEGIQSLYPERQKGADNFATIAAWAWGLQRGVDYFEIDNDIDTEKIAVFGWSRMGKAAL